ncbi:hypothetical protein F66182_14639 [Fusarium sp. NRRL 66182]|nr:hypothetical protein F66182_14639 [Fusarium sp. NRRL 66182]
MLATIPGLFMIERWGRRPLLLFGGIGMAISQFLVAGLGTGLARSDATNKASIVLICLFIFFYACSWGPVVWVVPGEIFSLKVRAKSMSLSTASNWLINWALAYSVPYMVGSGTGNLNLQAKKFFIWASFCVLASIIVWCLVYETKGLSLEQVDEMYAEIDKAWESHDFQAAIARRNSQRRSITSQAQPWNRHSAKTPSYSVHIEASPSSTLEDSERLQSRSSRGTIIEQEPSIRLRQFP